MRIRFFNIFHYITLCKTDEPPNEAPFDPRGITLTISMGGPLDAVTFPLAVQEKKLFEDFLI